MSEARAAVQSAIIETLSSSGLVGPALSAAVRDLMPGALFAITDDSDPAIASRHATDLAKRHLATRPAPAPAKATAPVTPEELIAHCNGDWIMRASPILRMQKAREIEAARGNGAPKPSFLENAKAKAMPVVSLAQLEAIHGPDFKNWTSVRKLRAVHAESERLARLAAA